jgi:putative protein kinase ArgK-like GTPase of G3E family
VTALLSRRTSADLPERLDALATVVETGQGRLDDVDLAEARAVVERAGERLRLSAHHTVVALAGATGSGKSSLFNALTGRELSPVAVRRPTTGTPHACVWGGEGSQPLLDRLGVKPRHTAVLDAADDPLDGLILVDLPDHDSTELAHRMQVDRLLDLVDLFVWVVDPQKYADGLLHERYLRPLAGHADVTVIAFNQMDRVDDAQAAQCLRDMERLLRDDGLEGARIVATSARTGAGVPDLRAMLAESVQARAARTARLAADVARVVERLADDVRAPEPDGLDRRERNRLAQALERAAGVPAVGDAAAASYRAQARRATGWPVTRWTGRLRRDPLRRLGLDRPRSGLSASQAVPTRTSASRAQVENAVRDVATRVSAGLPPAWAAAVRHAVPPDSPALASSIDEALTGADLSVRRRPLWWKALGLLQLLLVTVVVVGVVWLAALFVLAWFKLPEPPMAEVGELPLPTVLVICGVLGGLLVALLGRVLARFGGRRRARQVRSLLRARIAAVADDAVLRPMQAAVEDYGRVRRELVRAGARL